MAITGTEIRRETRSWGVDVCVEFEENSTTIHRSTFSFINSEEVTSQLSNRIDKKIAKIEAKRSILNDFDIGEDSVEIIRKAILAIRNSPQVNFTQAEAWYDNNFPDAVYKFDKFILRARNFIAKETGYVPTWNQFKTYVINNKFAWWD